MPDQLDRGPSPAALHVGAALLALAAALTPVRVDAATGRVAKSPAPAATEVVARVNGKPILRRDFELAVQMQFSGRRASAAGLEQLRETREKVLERLIDSELLGQKAANSRLEVKETEVDADLARLRGGVAKPEDFPALLAQYGVSEAEFRDQVRRSLLVTKFVDREVVAGLKVTDEDLHRYYDQNPTEMTRPEAVRVSQILVRVASDASPARRAAARQRIEAILKEVRGGQDFATLARRHSEGPEAARAGDSGFLTPSSPAPPPLKRAAFSLKVGQTSDVVETRAGFHILKVTEKREAGPIPFEEAQEKIRARLTGREREARIKAYVEALRQAAHIERMLPPAPPPAR
ncbi:MAG TPA: peptidyl-prolyl cis-trans isomerase [Candidatus Polarisedimenticolia bacterium]|nr:peptidyl-prolyl cis-trans isomerase [Candidatus Polarisedimenticolia bacterium]